MVSKDIGKYVGKSKQTSTVKIVMMPTIWRSMEKNKPDPKPDNSI